MAFIEGYIEEISITPGSTIRLHASSDGDKTSLSIFRIASPDVCMLQDIAISVNDEPVPEQAYEHGAGWPLTWEYKIPEDWPSGAYRITLRSRESDDRYALTKRCLHDAVHDILLIVRSNKPASTSSILLQVATNTYHAYNEWGGRSTYEFNSPEGQWPVMSTQRPGIGFFHCGLDRWEEPFIRFCDEQNIPLEYATNYELHTWPDGFDDYKLILSVGHDEYWSKGMRDNLEAFIGNGGNVAFFSGNSVCWQVRFEEDGRKMVTYKEKYKQDPYFAEERFDELTALWSHPLLKRTENSLTGVGFPAGGYHMSHGMYMDGDGAFTVHVPEHWIFEGTDLTEGEQFGGENTILGYECDGCRFEMKDGRPVPLYDDGTPESFQILAQGPAKWSGMEQDVFVEAGFQEDGGSACLGIYERNGTVLTVGSTDWAHGLGNDPIVDRITLNIIERLK